MERPEKHQNLSKELEQIYKQLIEGAKHDSSGVFWLSYNHNEILSVSENIYSGSAGILLFLIEYYSYKKNDHTLAIIRNSANWLESYCLNNPSKNFAFYTGRIGTIYTLIRARIIINDRKGIETSLDLLKKMGSKEYSEKSCFDFLNGLAGTVVGLLHIYDLTKEPFVKALICSNVNILVTHIQVNKQGFFWNKSERMIKPLCGFSHGISGISFAFLELGHYFNNPFFFKIAKRGMDFEDAFFNSDKINWPDFRKGYFDKTEEKKFVNHYLEGNIQFFEEPSYMTAWCHGSPGIALTRLRAYDLFQELSYKKQVDDIIENLQKNTNNPLYSFTWCHGFLGNNILFKESQKTYKGTNYDHLFLECCLSAIKSKEINGFYRSGLSHEKNENISLFLGIAGIGYSYIQALNVDNIFSPLLPCLNSPSIETLETFDIHNSVLENCKKRFPNTTLLLDDISSYSFSFENLENITLTEPMEKVISEDIRLQEIYTIELLKQEKENNIYSFSLLNMKKIINHQNFVNGMYGNFENIFVHLNPDVEILEIDTRPVLLYPNVTEFKLIEIDSSILEILMYLKSKKRYIDLINELKLGNPNILQYLAKETIIIIENEG